MSNKNEFVNSPEVLAYFNGDALAAQLWKSKYALSGEKTPKDMFKRFAIEFSQQEAETLKLALPNFTKKKLQSLSAYGKIRFADLLPLKKKHFFWGFKRKSLDELQNYGYYEYFQLFDGFKHSIIGGSAMQGIGANNYSSLSNCFVTGRPHDSYGGIVNKGLENIQLGKRRGGIGTDLSSIRPTFAPVNNQAKWSSGPVLFAQRYSNDTREVAQDGRRGAAMISLYIQHPDAREFIVSKQDPTKITGANISVIIDNEFMEAVVANTEYMHRFPIDMDLNAFWQKNPTLKIVPNELTAGQYIDKNGVEKTGYIKVVNAKELWDTLIECSHKTAEPGIMFLDNHLDYDPAAVYPQYKPVTSNPCFSKNTPVLTKQGYFNIVDLVGKTVEVWNGEEWSMVEPRITGENQEMLKIILSDGSEFECTKYHKWPKWIGFSDGKLSITEAEKLKIGDKLHKFELPVVEFGETIDTKIMYGQGFYSGDGITSANSAWLYGEKIKLAEYMSGSIVGSVVMQGSVERYRFNYDFPLKDKNFVPLNGYSIKSRLDWLAGLIDADGTVDASSGCQIGNSSLEFLRDIKLLLTTLGISSKINFDGREGYRDLPDQKGGTVNVWCKEGIRILLTSTNIKKLLSLGLKTYRCNFDKNFPKNDSARYVKIAKIEKIPNADKVYCFNEPKKHMGVFNGMLLPQCGEIMMQPYDSCRLIASNLLTFVDNPFSSQAKFNFKKFFEHSYEQMVAGNTLVDLELKYIEKILNKINETLCESDEEVFYKNQELALWRKIYETGKNSRRVGSGFLGLADALAALDLNYGDISSLKIVHQIFETKMLAELNATIDLSIIYGPFEGWNSNLETIDSSPFYSRLASMFPVEYYRMQQYGRRNVSWSTAAPTGTQALMTQTSSGIEPLFMPFYKRRKKCIGKNETVHFVDADGEKFTEFIVIHEPLKEWLRKQYSGEIHRKITITKAQLKQIEDGSIDLTLLQEWFEKSPYYKNCAADLSVDNRVAMQSAVQRYTTHSISSTVNLAETCTVDEVSEVFMKAWKNQLKGITVYREGSRNGVLVGVSAVGTSSDNTIGFLGKRPKILKANYHTLKFRNKVYSVIIGLTDDNKPYECFIVSGLNNLPENLDHDDVIEGRTVKDYTDIYYFENSNFVIRDIQDCEADEKLLGLTISGLMSSQTPMTKIIKIILKSKPIAGSFTHRFAKILSKYVVNGESTGDKCPNCGELLIFENGCFICKNCGHSKC